MLAGHYRIGTRDPARPLVVHLLGEQVHLA